MAQHFWKASSDLAGIEPVVCRSLPHCTGRRQRSAGPHTPTRPQPHAATVHVAGRGASDRGELQQPDGYREDDADSVASNAASRRNRRLRGCGSVVRRPARAGTAEVDADQAAEGRQASAWRVLSATTPVPLSACRRTCTRTPRSRRTSHAPRTRCPVVKGGGTQTVTIRSSGRRRPPAEQRDLAGLRVRVAAKLRRLHHHHQREVRPDLHLASDLPHTVMR